MAEKRFAMGDAVSFGWETVKGNAGFFIVLLIVAFLIQALPQLIANAVAGHFPLISIFLNLASSVLSIVVQLGLIKVSLKYCDNGKGKLDDLLSSFDILLKYFAAYIIYSLIILGGLLLLIVPGIIWAIKYSLFPYFIIDEGAGPIEAIKASGRATDGAKADLCLFGLLLLAINLAGALVFFVGLFITIPLSMIAYACVYRELSGKEAGSVTVSAEPGAKGGMYINLEG